MIHRLRNPIRDYPWGSHTHIARLTGRNIGDRPAAEMWMGAHRSAPSQIDQGGMTLLDLIASQPEQALGARTRTRFGDRLPFLMKLLAAKEPLSLQVHPARDRAERRFAEQEAAAIPLDGRERSYPDPSHKPELLHALTRFEGMAGYRDVRKTAAILRGLQLPWLAEVAAGLDDAEATATLKDLTSSWLSLPPHSVRAKLVDVRAAAAAAESRAHRAPRMRHQGSVDPSDVTREAVRVYSATIRLIDRYPGDPGVLVALLLNHLVLAPGESIFINAGVVHAYTSGFGVEIMASSDNVLRAGLTSKHVDIPELLEVADFSPTAPPRWTASSIRCGIRLAPPVDEFELIVLDVHGEQVTLEQEGPRIVLCLRDEVDLHTGDLHMALKQGDSAFVEPSRSPLTVSGHGRVSIGHTPPEVGGA